MAARIMREARLPGGLDVTEVVNDTTPEDGAARVVGVLRQAATDAERR